MNSTFNAAECRREASWTFYSKSVNCMRLLEESAEIYLGFFKKEARPIIVLERQLAIESDFALVFASSKTVHL